MQSFRPFSDGNLINKYRCLTIDDYLSSDESPFASYDAALAPHRTSIYRVPGRGSIFAVGGPYRRRLPLESFGNDRSISHRNHSIPLAFRPVVDNATYDVTDSDTLAIASSPMKNGLDSVLNEVRLRSNPLQVVCRDSCFVPADHLLRFQFNVAPLLAGWDSCRLG